MSHECNKQCMGCAWYSPSPWYEENKLSKSVGLLHDDWMQQSLDVKTYPALYKSLHVALTGSKELSILAGAVGLCGGRWRVQVMVEVGACDCVVLCCHLWDGKWNVGECVECALEIYHVLVESCLKNEQNDVRVWDGG